ncbi:ribosome biogenesis protein ytm1 [Leucoagaricus gongylophorus]
MSASWYEQVVQARCEKVDDLLVEGAKGFSYTSNQDRYDECEMAISRHSILAKGKYYTAIGLVTEAVLSRLLQDILMLSDIPEVDSHRLSELCRILNSLEGLFSEDSRHLWLHTYRHGSSSNTSRNSWTPQWQIYLIYSKKVPWWTSKLMSW